MLKKYEKLHLEAYSRYQKWYLKTHLSKKEVNKHMSDYLNLYLDNKITGSFNNYLSSTLEEMQTFAEFLNGKYKEEQFIITLLDNKRMKRLYLSDIRKRRKEGRLCSRLFTLIS